MATDTSTLAPYIAFKPGDPIRAEDQVQMQIDIKKDIQDQVKAAEDRIVKGSVAKADDATKFHELTDQQWIDKLNKLYAPIVHDHEGVSGYRRYFKKFSSPANVQAILMHKLGRFPVADCYILPPVFMNKTLPNGADANCRMVLYHGDEDATIENGLRMQVPNEDEQYLGVQLDALLRELNIELDRNESFEALVKRLWRALRTPPNDDLGTCELPWITDCCDKRFTVGQVQDDKEWEQVYVGFRPIKCGIGADPQTCWLDVLQINYNALWLSAARAPFGKTGEGVDPRMPDGALATMVLLRS